MTTIDFKAEVEKRKDALMEDLFSLLRIDSAMDMEHADAENPFGPGPRKALDAFLKIAERDGYTTKNYDNYVGHFEYENGANADAEVLGIIGHLDVVPAGSGWDSNPFEPEIRNGNLYARGASDDKGPTVACYYALKILKELNLPLSKKIRFIVGTNEETGGQIWITTLSTVNCRCLILVSHLMLSSQLSMVKKGISQNISISQVKMLVKLFFTALKQVLQKIWFQNQQLQ